MAAMAMASATLSILIGMVALLGWAFRFYDLTQLFTARSAMQPVTALCSVLSGAAIVASARPGCDRMVAQLLSAVVGILAVQTLAQHLVGADFGTDRLLFPRAIDAQPLPYINPGRMAAPTATAFLLLGVAIWLAQVGGRIAGRLLSASATAVLLLAAVAFLGHLYRVAPFTGPLSFTQVALPTSLALTGLSVGVLALKPRRGWVSLLVGSSVGATAARWLLPMMLAIPIVVALLALRGSDVGLYPADFRLALTTAVTVVLLGALALWGSWQLDSLVAVRRSTERLRENEATLRAFFETEGLFASVVERRGDEVRYLADNRALSALFGRNDVTGLTQAELVGAPEALAMAERLKAIEASGAPATGEVPHDAAGERRWFAITTSPIADSPSIAPRFTTASFEITDRKRAEAHQQTLLQELNHRVKNTLAIVQSLAAQTFRGDQATPAARHAFEQRLAAVAAANSLLIRQDWETVSLRALVADTVGPACGTETARIHVDGPDVALPARTAVSLTLALHELCTNAVKYGALSNEAGRVAIRWSVAPGDPARLRLTWTERGGPPVVEPSRRGFGSRLIERALAADLHSPASIAFRPEGVVCEIDAPLTAE